MACSLYLVAFAAAFQACSSKCLYFTSTGSTKIAVMKLDLSSTKSQATSMLEYPTRSFNPGGGGTGICRLGETLYWGDQLTGSVHSAQLSHGKLTNHNPSFIANLSDPQGVACDVVAEKIYVIDSVPGGGLRGFFSRSSKPDSPIVSIDVNGAGALRGLKTFNGSLWFGGDTGIFRSEFEKPTSVTLTKLPLSDGAIYEDFEVVSVKGKDSHIFAATYDWGGTGVLEGDLNPKQQNLTAPFKPMSGARCQKGSEMAWGIAVDPSTNMLYWVVNSDESSFKIVYQNYLTPSGSEPKVAYSSAGSGYGIQFDPEDADAIVV